MRPFSCRPLSAEGKVLSPHAARRQRRRGRRNLALAGCPLPCYSDQLTAELRRGLFRSSPSLTRVYVHGIFDLFSPSHAQLLLQAKSAVLSHNSSEVYLIVGVCSDATIERQAGSDYRPVIPDFERYEMLRHVKYVDEVMRDAPWVLDDELLFRHKIDYVLVADDDFKAMSPINSYHQTNWLAESGWLLQMPPEKRAKTSADLERSVISKHPSVDFFTICRRTLTSFLSPLRSRLMNFRQYGAHYSLSEARSLTSRADEPV